MAAALIALLIAAFLTVPAIYYATYIGGLFLGMALIKLLTLGLFKWRQNYAGAASALSLALLALALHYFLAAYRWTAIEPEPVRLWPLWLAELQGLTAVAAIFLAIEAKIDKASACGAFILATLALFLLGYNGMETLTAKTAGLSVIAGILLLTSENIFQKIKG